MYKHHEQSIENMKEYFRKQGAIALILVGSVARGKEREDSDLDGVVILSEEEYAEKEKSNTTTEIDRFVDKYIEITAYVPPKDTAIVLTRYSKDFQEWWREPRPNISEW